VTKDVNDAGIYAVNLYINGESTTVVVDDYFPFNEEHGKWAFSRPSTGNEIWVLILEKAWAKVFGSYSRIEVGDSGEAMPVLTGCPTKDYFISDFPSGELWQILKFADKSGFPMCCSANSAEEKGMTSDDMKTRNLVDAHAYTLIGVHEVELTNGDVVKLLKVRNPWGRKEWSGAWSDNSAKW
jgi:calpain-15